MKTCEWCEKQLTGADWELRKKRFCSRACLGRSNSERLQGNQHAAGHNGSATSFTREGSLGERNHRWGGGRYQDRRGYIFVKSYDHPRAVRGYIAEHVLFAEQQLGRLLVKGEEVHHINGDKSDNGLENLVVLTKAQHLYEHPRQRNSKGQFT